MVSRPGQAWQVGAVANGHILVAGGKWVPLNMQASHAGPWRPGDVVDQSAFTGTGWVPLPAGWWPDPTGRHQFRWWTGAAWSQSAMTSERQFVDPLPQSGPPSPIAPPLPARRSGPGFWKGACKFWQVVRRSGIGLYGSFWLLVAIHAGSIAVEEDNPRWLQLTVTACMNTLLFMLTGKTRGELKGQLRAGVRRTIERRGYYLSAGAFAAGGVALSLHLDVPDLLYVTMGGTMFLLVCAFIFN